MSKKEKPPKLATSRGATENVTGVYRLPASVKAAVEKEASADNTTPAAIVRQALARELERRKYVLLDETKLACHVD